MVERLFRRLLPLALLFLLPLPPAAFFAHLFYRDVGQPPYECLEEVDFLPKVVLDAFPVRPLVLNVSPLLQVSNRLCSLLPK